MIAGSEACQRRLLAREVQPVRRWLTRFFRRRIRDDVEVADLVQDVFARVLARHSDEPVERLGAYLAATALSAMADRARRRRARHADLHVVFDPELHGNEEIDPERVLNGKEELRAVAAALLSLPERTRSVFLLRRLEGHRRRDIAEHLGISVSAVEKHMHRADRHLRAAMEKHSHS